MTVALSETTGIERRAGCLVHTEDRAGERQSKLCGKYGRHSVPHLSKLPSSWSNERIIVRECL